MGFSNYEFDTIIAEEGRLAMEVGEKFHNMLHCEHAKDCEGMAARVAASPVRNQKVCYRNPGRKECKWFAFYERCPYRSREAG
jgi:hypothetical protein